MKCPDLALSPAPSAPNKKIPTSAALVLLTELRSPLMSCQSMDENKDQESRPRKINAAALPAPKLAGSRSGVQQDGKSARGQSLLYFAGSWDH